MMVNYDFMVASDGVFPFSSALGHGIGLVVCWRHLTMHGVGMG